MVATSVRIVGAGRKLEINAVEIYYCVSSTPLSVARHYGGARINGHRYEYDAVHDTLVRCDVVKRDQKRRAQEKKNQRVKQRARQSRMEFPDA